MIASEALLPAARRLFWKKQRFPIADAHYAMGFAFLSQVTGDPAHHSRAVHFLEVLEETRCPGYRHAGWGYPFDWVTRNGVMKAQTPLITSTPYVYEAFAAVYRLDGDPRWLQYDGVGGRARLRRDPRQGARSGRGQLRLQSARPGVSRDQRERLPGLPAVQRSRGVRPGRLRAGCPAQSELRAPGPAARRILVLRHRRRARLRRSLPHLLRPEGAGQDRGAHR